jgi:hypothetical protein
MSNCRFSPPWSVEETAACFIVRDANGQALAHVYYEEEPGATIGGQTAFARRGAADRGKLCQAAVAATEVKARRRQSPWGIDARTA